MRGTPGYIDDFTIAIGEARWTSNFTPPDLPYIKPNYPTGFEDRINILHGYK